MSASKDSEPVLFENWEQFDVGVLDSKLPVSEPIASGEEKSTDKTVASGGSVAEEESKDGELLEEILNPILESNAQPKMMILKRSPSAKSESNVVNSNEPIPEKSLAQREKEYQQARERIFADANKNNKKKGSKR